LRVYNIQYGTKAPSDINDMRWYKYYVFRRNCSGVIAIVRDRTPRRAAVRNWRRSLGAGLRPRVVRNPRRSTLVYAGNIGIIFYVIIGRSDSPDPPPQFHTWRLFKLWSWEYFRIDKLLDFVCHSRRIRWRHKPLLLQTYLCRCKCCQSDDFLTHQ